MALRTLSPDERRQIHEDIRVFLSDELGVPLDQVRPESKVLDDLKGDSMIYLELVQEYRKKFDVPVEIRVIGIYFQRHPVQTVAEVADAVCEIVTRGDELAKQVEQELASG